MRCWKVAKDSFKVDSFLRTAPCIALSLALQPLVGVAGETCKNWVTLSPALAAISLEVARPDAATEKLRGVSDYSPVPPGFPAVTIAGAGRLDVEKILSLKVACILHSPGVLPAAEIDRLSRVLNSPDRPRLISIPLDHLSEISPAYRRVGEVVGEAVRGRELASEFDARLAALREETLSRGRRHRVFVQLDEQPLVTLGGTATFLSEALAIVGVESVFSKLQDSYPRVSIEAVVAADPDRIWILGDTSESKKFDKMAAFWRERFGSLRAVKQGRVQVLEARDLTLPARGVLNGLKRVVADGLR